MKILVLLILLTIHSLFALVTIAPVEIGDNPGFSSDVETSLETKRGNTDTQSYKASARVTYDSNASYVTWAEISGAYGEANKEKNTDKLFSHARYIYKVSDERVRAEAFLQLQNDDFKKIKSRMLGGGGVRLKLHGFLPRSRGYLGLGGFYEDIRYNDSSVDPAEQNIRANLYFAYSMQFKEDASAAYTLYYQPKADDLSDVVQTHRFELRLNLYKELFLKFTLSWDIDGKPPVGVKKTDFTQNTSFVLHF